MMTTDPKILNKESAGKIQNGPEFNKQNFIRDLKSLNRVLFHDEAENEKRTGDKTSSK